MSNVDRASFDYIRALVREKSAIVLEPGKEYLVDARLTPLARRHGLESIAALVAKMRQPSANGLHREVVEAMTTNETSFFRDAHPFDALRTTILPELVRRRSVTRTLQIWSAASSSGQEIYTIAMTLRDHFPTTRGWTLGLHATDLSDEMVQRTREGCYSALEINRGMPAPMLVKHFDKAGLSWQAKPELRAMISARAMNLIEPWPRLPRMDVIMLRNVLIYFDVETKRRILQRVRETLQPDGYLFLGAAETTFNIDPAFEREQVGRASVYRLGRAA